MVMHVRRRRLSYPTLRRHRDPGMGQVMHQGTGRRLAWQMGKLARPRFRCLQVPMGPGRRRDMGMAPVIVRHLRAYQNHPALSPRLASSDGQLPPLAPLGVVTHHYPQSLHFRHPRAPTHMGTLALHLSPHDQ